MGELELNIHHQQITLYATIFLYGNMASDELAKQVADEINDCWNEPNGIVHINKQPCRIFFKVDGVWSKSITREQIVTNTNPRNNYFRVEAYSQLDISFVDNINCNTGYFKLVNLLNQSKTAAHEFGHTLGLKHPKTCDNRGKGQPGIMFPRGTLVDPKFQYDPTAPSVPINGGSLNPIFRKVLQTDIDALQLDSLKFSPEGSCIIGDFTNIYHEMHEQS